MLNQFKHHIVSLGGLGLIAASIVIEGGHLDSVIQLTAFLFMTTVSIGLSHAIDTSTAKEALAYILFRKPISKSSAGREMKALELVEKSTLVAGALGTGMGIIHVMSNMAKPEVIGPGVAVSLLCLVYCFAFNAVFVIPAKLAWLNTGATRNKNKTSVVKQVSSIPWIALACLGAGASQWLVGASGMWYLNASGLFLAGLLPLLTWLFYGRREQHRKRISIYGNLSICGALIAVIIQLIRVLENLDKPEIVVTGFAACMVPLLYGLVGAFYCKMACRIPVVNGVEVSSQVQNEEADFSYLPFMSFSSLSLVFIGALVMISLHT